MWYKRKQMKIRSFFYKNHENYERIVKRKEKYLMFRKEKKTRADTKETRPLQREKDYPDSC